MHAYQATETTFHYNSDFSGEVVAINKLTGKESRLHGEDILRFVALCYVAQRKIEQIEKADWCELLSDVLPRNKEK